MPRDRETFVPLGARIAGLLAEDLAREDSIRVVDLVDALQARGWDLQHIEANLGSAVSQAYLRAERFTRTIAANADDAPGAARGLHAGWPDIGAAEPVNVAAAYGDDFNPGGSA